MGLFSYFGSYIDFLFVHWGWTLLISFVTLIYVRYIKNDYTPPNSPNARVPELREYKGREIEMRSPLSGEFLGKENAATEEEVKECIKNARVAQTKWSQTSYAERRAVLQDLQTYIVENMEQIARNSVLETGKTYLEGIQGEVLPTCEKLRFIMAEGEKALSTEYRSTPLLMFLKSARLEYYPLGVIGVIVPWNFPFHNVVSAAISSIFSGNGVVIKTSEFSCYTRKFLQKMFNQVLAKRGHDVNLVQVITGYGDTGAALIKGGVDKVLFIGSPQTGKKVMSSASDVLVPVTLELGGKDPFIVLDDADFEQMSAIALRSTFFNCGQNCIAAERFYVQKSIYPKFVNLMREKVSNFKQGNALEGHVDIGAMCMPRQVEIVDELVQEAIKKGAKLETGGKKNSNFPNGLFYEPTVLSGVTHDMRIIKEETFGPVMLIIPFDTDEEVIRLANDTEFGLGSSIFSTNYQRAEKIANAHVSGMAAFNEWGISSIINSLPFGGVKVSGFGRFNGPEGLRDFCRQKSVVTDRFQKPFALRTPAPKFTQYPIPPNAPLIMKNAIGLIYGPASKKVNYLRELIQSFLSPNKQETHPNSKKEN